MKVIGGAPAQHTPSSWLGEVVTSGTLNFLTCKTGRTPAPRGCSQFREMSCQKDDAMAGGWGADLPPCSLAEGRAVPVGSRPLGGEGAMPFGLRLQDTKTTSVTQCPHGNLSLSKI